MWLSDPMLMNSVLVYYQSFVMLQCQACAMAAPACAITTRAHGSCLQTAARLDMACNSLTATSYDGCLMLPRAPLTCHSSSINHNAGLALVGLSFVTFDHL